MPMRPALVLTLCLAACAEFPALDARIGPEAAAAPYPALVPLAPILAAADSQPRAAAGVEAGLASRIAALRARAATLRGPVLTTADRQRLGRAI